jgi:thiol:disulfide interchange protein
MLATLLLSTLVATPFGNPFGGAGFNRPQTPQHHDSRDQVSVTIVQQRTHVAPGQDTAIAVIFDHNPGWHIHTNAPVVPPELGDADSYIATQIIIDVPAGSGVQAYVDSIQWPQTHEVEVAFTGAPVLYGVWEKKAVAFVPIRIAPDAPLGQVTIDLHTVFQACNDTVCDAPTPSPPGPGKKPSEKWTKSAKTITFDIVSPETLAAVPGSEAEPPVFKGFNETVFSTLPQGTSSPWLIMLITAAIGGFLLNLTPCVLPVIPLKIMALAAGSHTRSRTMTLGFSMMLGVIAFWIGIGLAIALVSGFGASNQLFQYPWFTIGVGAIIGAMAVGMCGLFTIQLPSAVYMVTPKHDTLTGSFLFGVMTAVLSTPCTAPFMGGAMAWALKESSLVVLITFAAIGIGMAMPYLVLAMFPKLTDKMPKAGPASELIKQVLGGLMLAAAVYFIGVGLSGMLITPPEPPGRGYFWAVVGVLVITALWLGWRTWQLTAAKAAAHEIETHKPVDIRLTRHALRWRIIGTALSIVVIAGSVVGGIELTDKGPIKWTYYLPDRFETALHEGDVVVLEFTAEWCLNCKALEETVLASTDVTAVLNGPGVVPMKVDLTGDNEVGRAILHEVDRHQIPLIVVFSPDGKEVFKADFYTAGQVLDAIERAGGPAASSDPT